MRRLTIIATAAAITAALLPLSAPAHAAEERVVHAGYFDEANPKPYAYTSFFPRGADGQSVVKVHRGDMVTWQFDDFHSVAFLSTDDVAGHPGFLRADELAGTFALNETWYKRSACDGPCVISTTNTFVSSGLPLFDGAPFSAKIDLPAGTYRYHCTLHQNMHGRVQVVPDAAAIPSQASLDAETAQEIAADTAAADALVENARAGQRVEDGKRVWTLNVGGATADGAVQVLGYLGRNPDGAAGPLRIQRDDTVEFATTGDEPHTVTFPNEAVGGFGLRPAPAPYGLGGWGIMPSCELDEPAAGAPALPFLPAAFLGCPAGELELFAEPWMTTQARAPLDAVLLPATVHNSAILYRADGAEFMRGLPAGSGNYLPSSFSATFPMSGTFTFGCTIHPGFMSGTIEVV